MVDIHIPDHLYARLQSKAVELGLDTDVYIQKVLHEGCTQALSQQKSNKADLAKLQLGADQLSRGEAKSSEETMAWLSAKAQVLTAQ